MRTLRQFADTARRAYVLDNPSLTLAEMLREMPDSMYTTEHHAYVMELASDKGTAFSAHMLNSFYRTYGGNAMRILFKFHPHVRPLYYVHPDFRTKE